MNAAVGSLKSRVDVLTTQLNDKDKQIKEVKKEVEKKEAEGKKQMSEKSAEIKKKDAELKEKTESLRKSEEQRAAALAEAQAAKSLVEQKTKEVKDVKAQINQDESQTAKLKRQVEEKDSDIKNLKLQIEQKNGMLQNANSLTKTKDSEIEKLQKELRHKDKQVQQKDSEVQAVQKQLQSKDSQFQDRDSDIQNVKKQLKDKDKLISEKDVELGKGKKLLQQKEQQAEKLTQQLADKATEFVNVNVERSVLLAEIESFKAQVFKLQNALSSTHASLALATTAAAAASNTPSAPGPAAAAASTSAPSSPPSQALKPALVPASVVIKREEPQIIVTDSSLIFPRGDLLGATSNFHSKIGEGICGEVFKGRLRDTPVVIKRLAHSVVPLPQLQAELAFLSKYRHPDLVTWIGRSELSEDRTCLVYPLLPQGSLRDRLDCRDGTPPLPWDVRIKAAWQAASVLAFLHSSHTGASPLLHLSVKSDNLLLDNDYDAKVADFGLVKVLGLSDLVRSQATFGTMGYLCPAYLAYGVTTVRTDVYAFGVVLAELVTGKPAVFQVRGGKPALLASMMTQSMTTSTTSIDPFHLDPNIRDTWPQESLVVFARLMRECIDPDPNNRPTMAMVANTLKTLAHTKHRICLSCVNQLPTARLECGHVVLCDHCAAYFMERGNGCPLCRGPVMLYTDGGFSKAFVPS